MTDLIVRGGALPTFLLDRIAAATGARAVVPCPPQNVRFRGARRSEAFEALQPLLNAEGLTWVFEEAV